MCTNLLRVFFNNIFLKFAHDEITVNYFRMYDNIIFLLRIIIKKCEILHMIVSVVGVLYITHQVISNNMQN